ncbi:MAG: Hpt domain-containing protein [Treponema sp.]|jgi:HPt (histidine-containing phosphotransfer) domain-containing protein|nr:Hpt domain-containing protein [Treponema sp.]
MADIVYIDQVDGKKRVMNNGKLYSRLLGKFRDETKLEPVWDALDAGDYEKAQMLVHTIKGVTANLSVKALNQLVVELESQIKVQAVNLETVEAVKSCLAATLPEVEKVIAENA